MISGIQASISQNIKQYGWHAQHVYGDDIWPAFTYSIGWGITRDWPEMIVVGQRQEVAHGMLERVWDSADLPMADAPRIDILDGFTCHLKQVDLSWYEFLFGAAIDHYMDRNLPAFRAMQCVWPTTRGVLPWDSEAPDGFDRAQPLVFKKMEREPGT